MICKFCKHKWETRSKLLNVSCPSCLNKNRNGNMNEVNKNGQKKI